MIIRHSGKWLHFQDPERVLRTERAGEVVPLLREAEESGLFVAGFVSYEAAPAFDSALKVQSSDGFPLLCLGLFQTPEVLDGIERGGRGTRRTTKPEQGSAGSSPSNYKVGELKPSVSKEEFLAAIGEIKERIAEGATYQVNYTYRLNAGFSGDALAFFCELVEGQRVEHAAFVDIGDLAICSASPELFFSLEGSRILARPMKGTAPRGRTFSEDWKQAEALRVSEKDRAENIMIVDMIRNDMGRIARPGSVETLRQFDVEKYPTLWQMTSTVRGKLEPRNRPNTRKFETEGRKGSKEDLPLGDLRDLGVNHLVEVMQAMFPCASITGAPKAKTMEIIQGLETAPRKIYTGSMGFRAPSGEASWNVAIRTALIDRTAGTLEYGVGGGIVWDSEAGAEYEETLAKARILTQPRPGFQLLETLLWTPGEGFFLLDEHLQRLGKSAAYFDVPLDIHAVFQALEEKPHTFKRVEVKVRLLVDRGGDFELQSFPLESGGDVAPTIALAKEPVDSQDIFLFHKTTHRAVYERAKADFPEAGEVVLWNERGEITEGSMANVVIRKGGRLLTPPVECGLLAGTFREHLLETGEIEEGVVAIDDLKAADEIFLVNSVRRWRRAVFP